MRFFNFSIEGENVEAKIKNPSVTRFPEHRIYANDTLTCFNLTNHLTEVLAVFTFNYEDNPNIVQVNIGSTDKEILSISHWVYEKIITSAEYTFFENWCKKWDLTISKPQPGCYPTLEKQYI